MYSSFTVARKYLHYWLSSSNGKGHGIHSPFVFEFVTKVLNDKTRYPAFEQIEKLRRKLLTDKTPVPVEDYGAGSVQGIGSRSVSTITRNAAKSPKYARLLYRMVQYYKPQYIIELGTSLGISTCYLAAAGKDAVVVTGEGNFVVASMARNNFESLDLHNVRVIVGNFDNTLPEMVRSAPHVDLAFIDGNHREEPTKKYFRELLLRQSESSIIIFDDIHWSHEMEAAWEFIKNHEAVMLTVDLFFIGIVFFRPEFKVKQHFTIRF